VTSPSIGGISGESRKQIAALTSRGRSLVWIEDAAAALKLERVDAAKKLAKWASKGWLRRVRRGLYVAVPIDVESPALWTEDPFVLANAVWAPCFFSGWSAASHWGLTEQIFRTIVVKTNVRVRRSAQKLLDQDYLVHHSSQEPFAWGLTSVWRRNHQVQFADPTRTIVDIFSEPRLGGGIRHATEILATFLGEHDPERLIEYGERNGNRTVFKRLGYVLETLGLGGENLIDACRSRISTGFSLLEPTGPESGVRIARWQLRTNVQLEPPDSS